MSGDKDQPRVTMTGRWEDNGFWAPSFQTRRPSSVIVPACPYTDCCPPSFREEAVYYRPSDFRWPPRLPRQWADGRLCTITAAIVPSEHRTSCVDITDIEPAPIDALSDDVVLEALAGGAA